MKKIWRRYDIKKLVYELGNNKVDALELLREALSNAKDHQATNLFLRTKRDNMGRVSVLLMDDGHGLSEPRWEAFWGAAASCKLEGEPAIGYKGFGTKLYFHCGRLSVASRTEPTEPWSLVSVERPSEDDRSSFDMIELPDSHDLAKALRDAKLSEGTGTAILIEDLQFTDKDRLLSHQRIASYCDWFTVLGDVRSGLFDSRLEFHNAVRQGGRALDGLGTAEVPIRPVQVHLQLNGDRKFTPLGADLKQDNQGFFDAWSDDAQEHKTIAPGLWMFGHRFADAHPAGVGKGGQRKDDRTALRLTGAGDWVDDYGFSVVAHVEGHRRQRETYPEAGSINRSQSKKGVYSFDDRFGLWLCRDYVAVAQRNDLLKRAIAEAETRGLEQDFKTLRNWKVFVNHRAFLPIANRGDVSNYAEHESRLFEALVDLLRRAFKQADFMDWVQKLQSARRERERENERALMSARHAKVIDWVKKGKDGVDPVNVALRPRDLEESLRMRVPTNEQELFYLYAQLSARFEVPFFVLEYETREGVDAIARVSPGARGILPPDKGYARLEFKYEVESGFPIGHYFDAIDAIICWSVGRPGAIGEEGYVSIGGQLRRRERPVLEPPFDTHEIVYHAQGDGERVIPVLQLQALFADRKPAKGKRG